MKKITFILLALISGTAFGQSTVSSSAEIIEAISFVENTGLNFGKVDNSAGTVTIAFDGTSTGKTQIAGGTTTAGDLTVSGEPNEAYNITVSGTATLNGPGTMNITGITHNGTGSLDAAGDETFQIGGVLNVGDGQATGTYSGSISVTVAYN